MERIDSYGFSRPVKGLALIVDNVDSSGTRADVARLEDMFRQLSIHVGGVKVNPDAEEMRNIARTLSTENFEDFNSLFLVVIGHGLVIFLLLHFYIRPFDYLQPI